MTAGELQQYGFGNLAGACHLRGQPKVLVFHDIEERLPPLPSLFLKKRKMRNTEPLKSLSKVVAMAASSPTLTLASIQMDRTPSEEVAL
jgi:hypothetical protein